MVHADRPGNQVRTCRPLGPCRTYCTAYPTSYLTGAPRSLNATAIDNAATTSEATTDGHPISLTAFAPKHTMPERVRQAISAAQRKRWKDNPELRAQVSAKLKVWLMGGVQRVNMLHRAARPGTRGNP